MFLARAYNRFFRSTIQTCFSVSRYFSEVKPPGSVSSTSSILHFGPELPLYARIEVLAERESIYVDKTESIYDLLEEVPSFIITRPRRFGKSLFLSVVAAIAQKKGLLQNLAIGSRFQQLKEYPVLEFNFARDVPLEKHIDAKLEEYSIKYGLKFKPGEFELSMDKLIKKIYAEYGPLCILVDEFDYPTYNMNEKAAEDNLRTLKSFLLVLKGCEHFTKNQVITGVTTPDYLELGSGGNHLRVLTFEGPYATLFGFTEDEIKHNFGHYLKLLESSWSCNQDEVWRTLRECYNGYSFSEESTRLVYNPYSIIECLRTQELGEHWSRTGGSSVKLQQMYENFANSKRLRNKFTVSNGAGDLQWKLQNPDINLALWSFGYLTIESFNNGVYYLKPPNKETNITIENSK